MWTLTLLLLAASLAGDDRRIVAIDEDDAYWTWSARCAPQRVEKHEQPCVEVFEVEIRVRSPKPANAAVIWGTEAMLRELPDAVLPGARANEQGIAVVRIPRASRVFARVAGPSIASGWTLLRSPKTEIAAVAAVEPKFRVGEHRAQIELRTADAPQPENLAFRGAGNGEVTIPPIPADNMLRILAWSATAAPAVVIARAAELPPAIDFPAGHSLRGSIEPARDASITATFVVPHDRTVIRRKGRADSRGRFALSGLSDAAFVTWTASSEGFATATDIVRIEKDLDLGTIVLKKPRSVLVRVAGEDGRPLANARVTTRSGEAATTAPNGTARLAHVPADELIVSVTAQSHLKQEVEIPADVAEFDVRLVPSASVRARIVRADGEPAGPGNVSIVLDGLHRLVELDQSGNLLADDLPAGKLTLEIRADGAAPLRLAPRELAKGEALDLGRLEVDGGIAIAGRVVDPSGAPLAGVTVRVLRPGADPPLFKYVRRDWVTAESAADGTFAIRGLSAGVYALWTESRGHAPLVRSGLVVSDDARSTGLDLGDLPLSPARMVSVACVPVERCGSEASVAVEGADWLSVSAPMTGGHATIGPVASGPAVLRVVDGSYALYERSVSVSATEAVTAVRIDLSGLTVRGRITRGGKPVAGGSMLCSTMSSDARPLVMLAHSRNGFTAGHEMIGVLPRELTAAVDGDGRFELRDLAAGEYELTWIGSDHRSLPRRLAINASVDLRFELPEGTIEGIVRSEKERRRVGVVVDQGGRKSQILTWTGERFSIAGLDPGEVRVQATEVGVIDGESAEAQLMVGDREPAFVELTLGIRRRDELRVVVRRDGGVAASNAFVFLRQAGAIRLATTDAEGRASFRTQAGGPAQIAVYSPSHGWAFADSGAMTEVVVSLRPSAAGLIVTTEHDSGAVELWSSSSFPIHQALAVLGIAPTARRASPLRVTGLPVGSYRVVLSGEMKTIELRDETRDLRF